MADLQVPRELVESWRRERILARDPRPLDEYVADRAAQWGADQQLKKINLWIRCWGDKSGTGIRWELTPTQLDCLARELWAAMRPKSPTLAEQALKQYGVVEDILLQCDKIPAGCIRAALNRLAELESQQ